MSLAEYKPEHFSHETRGDVVIVKVIQEKLSEEQNLEEIGQELFKYVDQYDSRLLALDCSLVKYASSSAIGKLITLHRKLNRIDGHLAICGLQQSFMEILQAARLYNYFKVSDTAEAAVAVLQGESE